MPTTHVETETTFEAPPEFQLPDMLGLPGVATVEHLPVDRLHAVYFDTDDLRLLRSSVTLRRRVGGADEGWHLKLPTRTGSRLEVRAPAGDDAAPVPAELATLSRSVARNSALDAVVELRTQRIAHRLLDSGGTVLAEVAEDAVAADLGAGVSPKAWHEIEVELVGGDDRLLSAATKLLVKAGARVSVHQSKLARALSERLPHHVPVQRRGKSRAGTARATAGDVAVAYVGSQVDALVRLDPLVRLDTPDAVHKMRVAARRLRSGLATFGPVFDAEATRPLRAELQWLGEVLAPARDTEVLRERLLAQARALPDELLLGPVVARIQSELGRATADAARGTRDGLDDPRFVALLDSLEAFRTQPPFTPVAAASAHKVSSRRVRDAARRVEHGDRVVQSATSEHAREEALHDVRKRAKRARYAAEATSGVLGVGGQLLGERMSQLQEVLGAHQDATVARGVLRQMGVRAHLAGENGFTFGLLLAAEQARADAAVAAYPRALRRALTASAVATR